MQKKRFVGFKQNLRIMTKYQENFIYTISFIEKILKMKMVTLLLGHPVQIIYSVLNSKGTMQIIEISIRKAANPGTCISKHSESRSNQKPMMSGHLTSACNTKCFF